MTPTDTPQPVDPIDRGQSDALSPRATELASNSVDTAALLALAKAATPGPWRADDEHGDIPDADAAWCVSATKDAGEWAYDIAFMAGRGADADDAAFIAAANPETVTRLCEELGKLRRGGATLGRIVDHYAEILVAATGSRDVIGEDMDGDWEIVEERLANLGRRAASAESERDAARAELARLRAFVEGVRGVADKLEIPSRVEDPDAWEKGYAFATRDAMLALRALLATLDDKGGSDA